MLRVSNLEKYFGEQLLFEQSSFVVSRSEKVGIVGPNGCGKTTLLLTVAGLTESDYGSIALPEKCTVGFVPQSLHLHDQLTLGEYVAPQFFTAHQRLLEAAASLETIARLDGPDCEKRVLLDYDRAVDEFENAGGYAGEGRFHSVLQAVDLECVDPQRMLKTLSGGQKTRAALARVLLLNADLLLLDEPTNNLDLQSIEWLEKFIDNSPAACMIVSHDRFFLDRTCTRILELDPLACRRSKAIPAIIPGTRPEKMQSGCVLRGSIKSSKRK